MINDITRKEEIVLERIMYLEEQSALAEELGDYVWADELMKQAEWLKNEYLTMEDK